MSCSTGAEGDGGGFSCVVFPDSQTCREAANLLPSVSSVGIKIEGPLNLRVLNNTNVRLRGVCNDGGYPSSHIRWEITDTGPPAVLHSSSDVDFSVQCKEGKFDFIVRPQLQQNTRYELRARIHVFSKEGTSSSQVSTPITLRL